MGRNTRARRHRTGNLILPCMHACMHELYYFICMHACVHACITPLFLSLPLLGVIFYLSLYLFLYRPIQAKICVAPHMNKYMFPSFCFATGNTYPRSMGSNTVSSRCRGADPISNEEEEPMGCDSRSWRRRGIGGGVSNGYSSYRRKIS